MRCTRQQEKVTLLRERQSIATTRLARGNVQEQVCGGRSGSTELGRATWQNRSRKGGTKKSPKRGNRKSAFIGSLYQAKPERQVPTRGMVTRKMLTEIGVKAQARRHYGLSTETRKAWYKRRYQKKGGTEARISGALSTQSVATQDFPLRDTRKPASQVRILHSPDMQATFQELGMLEQS